MKMPASLCGTWDIISNVNLDGYMIALGKSIKHDVRNYLAVLLDQLFIVRMGLCKINVL